MIKFLSLYQSKGGEVFDVSVTFKGEDSCVVLATPEQYNKTKNWSNRGGNAFVEFKEFKKVSKSPSTVRLTIPSEGDWFIGVFDADSFDVKKVVI